MKKRLVFFLSAMVMLALACNISSSPTATAPGNGNQPVNTPQGGANQPGNPPAAQPTGTPPANPVSINDGLASLNSYQMTVTIKSTGPDPTQSGSLVVVTQRSQNPDASYTHTNQSSVDKGGANPSTGESNIYQIGNDQCSGSGTDWTWKSLAPNETEMLDLVKSMLGLTPLIDTPTFVAQETVNGIPSNHFTFKVSGLGVKSGAQVNANQGDYWLAVDGQYIVKYTLVIETSTNPTDVLHEEISIELNQVNQPINIVFPQSCLDASKVTPEP